MSKGFVEKQLGITAEYAANARAWLLELTNAQQKLPALFESAWSGDTHERIHPGVIEQVVSFFKKITHILSGATRHTRQLAMKRTEVCFMLFAEWPALLRALYEKYPRVLDRKGKKDMTILQKNVHAAIFASEQVGFSVEKEHQERLKKAQTEYARNLRKKQLKTRIAKDLGVKMKELNISFKQLDGILGTENQSKLTFDEGSDASGTEDYEDYQDGERENFIKDIASKAAIRNNGATSDGDNDNDDDLNDSATEEGDDRSNSPPPSPPSPSSPSSSPSPSPLPPPPLLSPSSPSLPSPPPPPPDTTILFTKNKTKTTTNPKKSKKKKRFLPTAGPGFDPATHLIKPCAPGTFWNILKTEGVRFTQAIHRHPCKKHDEGPGKEVQLELVRHRLAIIKSHEILTDEQKKQVRLLMAVQTSLALDVSLYHLHLEQYCSARKKVKQIENNLEVGEALIYRDFVNQHSVTGGKVMNLVLSVLYRVETGGPLFATSIHNVCTDEDTMSSDAAFVADVFDFHLKKKSDHNPGTFDNFHKIYLSGDHGSHFSSGDTMYNESTWFEKYKMVVECHFLCSYHAFNRCDGAGVTAKNLSIWLQRVHLGPVSASDFALAMNNSDYVNSVAYPFDYINKPVGAIPELKTKGLVLHCCLKYFC